MQPPPRFSWLNLAPNVALALVAGCASSPPSSRLESAPSRIEAREPPRSKVSEPSLARDGEQLLASRTERSAPPSEEAAKVAAPERREPPDETAYDAPRVPLPRLTSVGLFTHIYVMPSRRSYPLGYVHVGGSVALRRTEPLRNESCETAWYAVEPRGFVCNDNTTLLESDQRRLSPGAERLLKGYEAMAPSEGPLPYGYALSLGTPMYGRIPEPLEQRQHESVYGAPPLTLGQWAKGHDGLASSDPVRTGGKLPWFLANGAFAPVTVRGRDWKLVRKIAPRGSMISYSAAFEAEGRTWLLTPEGAVVPADRVRVYRTTSFHGIELGDEIKLPIAWIRKRPRPKWRAVDRVNLGPTADLFALRTAVGLTGKKVLQDNRALLETVEAGTFLDAADATVVEKAERPASAGKDDKWIRISIQSGTLTAYEGDKPVFATLISPGIGGLSPYKYPSVHALAVRHTTPLGVHRIQFKDRFSVMSPDPEQKKFFIADVPYIQYFYGPFALHASFWHEDFGEPKSGGCVNLSPADAERIFAWTEPALPTGWHAVRPGGPNGPGTVVQVVP